MTINVDVIPEAAVASAQVADVSNYQGVMSQSFWRNFQAGFCKATEGTTFRDGTFAGNWAGMKAAGIPRGAYHFFHPALNPVTQAQFFYNFVKSQGLNPGDMLVADVEIVSGNAFSRFFGQMFGRRYRNNLTQKPVASAFVDTQAKAFLDELHTLTGGKNPILVYTDLSVGSTLSSCTGYPLWIAFYSSNFNAPSNVLPWKNWVFWQWGIVNNIDRDAFNGTSTDLKNWLNSFNPQPPPQPGPRRLLTNSGDTIANLAASRNVKVSTWLARQARDYNLTDYDALSKAHLPAGIPYYEN